MNRTTRHAVPEPSGYASRIAIVGALLLAVAFADPAAAQLTRGAVSGTVRDATGALVPGATVTVTNTDTNQAKTAVTDAQGFYRVAALEPGPYTVRTELAGFSTVETRDVPVRSASEVSLNVELKVGGTTEAITVTGRTEAVELNKTDPTIGLTSTARQAVELPLSTGRNINNLILLTPNTLNLNAVNNGATGVGQGSYVVNGQRSRNNNYMIDGSDNNDISVTIATSQIVPEAVAEFHVQTNSYSAEFGRNSGGQINLITKSGTNSIRGEAWEYYTTSGLYSLSNIEKANGLTTPPKYHRHQFGLDIGGPIIKDKLFFFALYQHDIQRPESHPGLTTRIPTPAGFAALQNVPIGAGQTAASRAAVLQRISFLQGIYGQNLKFQNVSTTLVNGVPIETGQANVGIVDPSTYKSPLFRLDYKIGAGDNLTARYSYNGRVDNNLISNCVFGDLYCGGQDLKDTNAALSETHTFSSNVLNEARLSLVKRNLLFPENDPTSPTASISGLFQIGGDSNFPQGRVSDSWQFSDTVTWLKGKHALKFGADIRYNKLDNIAAFNSKGVFTFNSLQDYMNNNAFRFQQALQTASFKATQWQTSFFVQDDFHVGSDLTLNLGLRYELSTVPLGFFGATDAQSLGALVPPPVKKDTNNWAPRVGFAWSPRSGGGLLGNGKTVVRGGWGIGYDVLFYNLLVVDASNFPRVVTADVNNVQNVYPNLLPTTATAIFNPLATWTNSPVDTQTPSAQFYSLSVQREIGDFIVELGYTGSRGFHGINQIDLNPARVVTPEQAALVRQTGNVNAIPGVQARRLFPQFGSRTTIPSDLGPGGVDTEARSTYNAGFITVNKRFSHGIQAGASYTLSRFMSNNDASLGEGGTTRGSSQRPQDYFDYASEWSVSQFDRTHRFITNYIWELPGPKSGVLKQVLGGWQVSGVTQFQSGRPFTIITNVDSNGDGNTGSDRPNINSSGTFVWDKDHKSFVNNGYYTAPVGSNGLPLANALGNGNAPRNSERGAPFWQTDLSVLKRFSLGQRQLHIRADVINAFNQDRYDNPVNLMNSPSFGQNTNDFGRRSVLLSAKVVF
jgi:Carboxypeptidase regulatory-like domain/TonB dependent receptor-like, beta-barrel